MRLLPVAERARELFGDDGTASAAAFIERDPIGSLQQVLFPEAAAPQASWLLPYEVATPQSLRHADQELLADLKDGGFRFLRFE